jgi:hypothetical protein
MVRLHLPAKYYYKSIREQPTEIHRRHILIIESYLLQADSRESHSLLEEIHR